jgi:hypothetical protein
VTDSGAVRAEFDLFVAPRLAVQAEGFVEAVAIRLRAHFAPDVEGLVEVAVAQAGERTRFAFTIPASERDAPPIANAVATALPKLERRFGRSAA